MARCQSGAPAGLVNVDTRFGPDRTRIWKNDHRRRVVANYTTVGPYDFVFIIELPSAEVALEGSMTFGSQGEVRTLTMLAIPTSEAEVIAQRVP